MCLFLYFLNRCNMITRSACYAAGVFCWLLVCSTSAFSQKNRTFTRQDTLRGSITPERAWWDLVHYDLRIKVNPQDSSMHGTNLVRYKVLKAQQVMQLDLQPPMRITQVTQNGQQLAVKQDGNAWYITLPGKQAVGALHAVEVQFGGKPKVSRNPPWSAG